MDEVKKTQAQLQRSTHCEVKQMTENYYDVGPNTNVTVSKNCLHR